MTGHRLTFGDDGSAAANAAWSAVIRHSWTDWWVDILEFGEGGHQEVPPVRMRSAPSRCGIARLRVLPTSLSPRAALLGHQGTDVIAIGAAGGPAGSLSRGSWQGVVIRSSRIPVLLLRDTGEIRRVAVFVDQSDDAATVVSSMAMLPWLALTIVTVLPVQDSDEGTAVEADEVARGLSAAGVRATMSVLRPASSVSTTAPRFRMLDAIDRLKPDLVVIGGPRRSLLARMARGRTSIDVIAYASCSALVIPR